MDKLIITVLALQTILILMWVFTQNKKLKSIEGQIRANNVHIDGQANKIIATVEEKAQFQEKALGEIADNCNPLVWGLRHRRTRE